MSESFECVRRWCNSFNAGTWRKPAKRTSSGRGLGSRQIRNSGLMPSDRHLLQAVREAMQRGGSLPQQPSARAAPHGQCLSMRGEPEGDGSRYILRIGRADTKAVDYISTYYAKLTKSKGFPARRDRNLRLIEDPVQPATLPPWPSRGVVTGQDVIRTSSPRSA